MFDASIWTKLAYKHVQASSSQFCVFAILGTTHATENPSENESDEPDVLGDLLVEEDEELEGGRRAWCRAYFKD